MARRLGMPEFHYAMLPHPIANLTPEECCERAASILSEVLTILDLEDAAAEPRQSDAAPPEQVPWPMRGGV